MTLPRYNSYKDSGVEWLGEVPSHWDTKRLGQYFTERREKVSDKDFSPLSVTKNGIVPQLDTAAKTDDGDNRKKVCAGDFVINSRSDRKGSSGLSPLDGSVSLINAVIEPNDKLYARYVHHLLRSTSFQEEYYRYGKGIVADLWSTNYSEMKDIILAVPSLPEQKDIADFLDRETGKIDGLVAEQERLIALLTEKRQAVISHAVTKGLNPTAPMKPSGIDWLGHIPAHWDVAALKHVANIATGYAFNSELFIEDGVPVIRIGDILLSGSIDIASAKCIVADDLSLYEKYLVQKNDILMAMTGATIGKAGWFDSEQSALLNQRVCYFRAKENAAQRYVWYVLATHFYCEYLRLTAFGGAQPNISDGQLVSCIVCVPTFDEQSAIAEFLDQETSKFDDLIVEAEKAITILQERRTALISAAVTGKIDVRGTKPQSEAA